MNLQALSIKALKHYGEVVLNDSSMSNNLQDDIIITNNISYSELFKFPCRLDAISLLVCVKGGIKGTVNLKQYELGCNGVFLALPKDILCLDSMTDVEAYAIVISTSFLREINIDLQKLMPLYLNIRWNSTATITDNELNILENYYTLALNAIYSNNINMRDIIKGLLTALVYEIISYVNQYYSTVGDPNKRLHRNDYIFDEFMILLNEHHIKERSVKFYANKMCITPRHLSLIIKKVSGETAAQWIDAYVILESKNLLKFSNMSIQQVAYHLNFATQSSFGKYFKQQTGLSPKQFINSSNIT